MVKIRRDENGRVLYFVKEEVYDLDENYTIDLYRDFNLRSIPAPLRLVGVYTSIDNMTCHCGGRIDIVNFDVVDNGLDLSLQCSDCGARYIAKLIKEVVEPCRVVHIDTQRDFYDIDEWYGNWYKCPYCKHSGIWYRDNYCSRCGSKLEWSGKDRDE